MTDAEFEEQLKVALAKAAEEARRGRRLRRTGSVGLTIRQENGNIVRPITIELKDQHDVKP